MSSTVTMLAGGTNDLEIFAGTRSMIYSYILSTKVLQPSPVCKYVTILF